jgi:hypothetical protein
MARHDEDLSRIVTATSSRRDSRSGEYTHASAGSIFPIGCRQRLFADASNVELSNVEHIGHPLARSIRKQHLTMPGGSEVSEPV